MCDVSKLKIRKKCRTPLEQPYIYIKKEKETLAICQKCWDRIAEGDWEIGDNPKLTMEQILSDTSRMGENPVETEIRQKKSKVDENEKKDDEEF
jgi:hypothetical protein